MDTSTAVGDAKPVSLVSSIPSKALDLNLADAHKTLGNGPMRFALIGERSVKEQVDALDPTERGCFDNLKNKWEEKYPDSPYADEMYLRFARCSPGAKKFNEKSAFKVMQKFDKRFLSLVAAGLGIQLMSKTLFPIPGLKTRDGDDVLYMRPSRYFPDETSTKEIIDNLAYCMNTMVEKEKNCKEGIAFIAYMNDCHMKNFSFDCCYQFMTMLQGKIPVRVRLFLIVNPPGWFGKLWNMMRLVLPAEFREKVRMIPESELPTFFPDYFTMMLPDDTDTGQAPTDKMVADFITYRMHVES